MSFMQSDVMLTFLHTVSFMLSVPLKLIMLSVIMLSVVYPKCRGAIAVASIRMTKATKVLD
jgi:hypothetical protein